MTPVPYPLAVDAPSAMRFLGDMYRSAPLPTCPSCRVKLVEATLDEDTRAWQCERCDGIWLEEPSFWSLYREHLPDPVVRELMIHNDGTPRRDCPACHEEMEIAWIDLLQLDRCAKGDGVWFDAGDLQRALSNDVGQDSLEPIEAAGEARRRARAARERKG